MFLKKPNSIEWTILIVGILGFVFGMLSIISLSSLLCNRRNNIECSIVGSSIIALISYTATNAFFIAFFLYKIDQNMIENQPFNHFLENIWAFIWNIAQLSCYILFYKRFKCTFDNSTHSISKKFKYYIYASILLYVLFEIFLLFVAGQYLKNYIIDDGKLEVHIFRNELIYDIGSCVLNLLITVALLASFLNRLKHVARNLDDIFLSTKKQMTSRDNTSSLELSAISHKNKTNNIERNLLNDYGAITTLNIETSEQLIKLFNLMSKLFILCGLMIISTQLLMITILFMDISRYIMFINDDEYPINNSDILYLIYWYYFMRNMDCIIGSTCVYLTFNINDNKYKCCCKYIHKYIREKCTKQAIRISFELVRERVFS